MRTLPPLIIVADRGHLTAYQSQSNGSLRALQSEDIAEGLEKLSSQVTDKAGRFPDMRSIGKGNSSAERLPLVAELEARTFRKLARFITDLCVAHQPDSWGFAAPAEINRAILDGLDDEWLDHLKVNLRQDLTGMSAQQVAQHFTKRTRQAELAH